MGERGVCSYVIIALISVYRLVGSEWAKSHFGWSVDWLAMRRIRCWFIGWSARNTPNRMHLIDLSARNAPNCISFYRLIGWQCAKLWISSVGYWLISVIGSRFPLSMWNSVTRLLKLWLDPNIISREEQKTGPHNPEGLHKATPNFPTKILDVRGFDSIAILSLRGGILRCIGNWTSSRKIWVNES